MDNNKKEELKELISKRDQIYKELQLYAPKYHELKEEYMRLTDEIWELEDN